MIVETISLEKAILARHVLAEMLCEIDVTIDSGEACRLRLDVRLRRVLREAVLRDLTDLEMLARGVELP